MPTDKKRAYDRLRAKNPSRQAWTKIWRKTPEGKKYQADWRRTEKGREVNKKALRKWYAKAVVEQPIKLMLWATAARARKRKIVFDLKESDIVIPTHCPVLGIPLFKGCRNSPNSPSIDRHIPSLGYVIGNISIISYRANTLKRDASLEELSRVVEFMKTIAPKEIENAR